MVYFDNPLFQVVHCDDCLRGYLLRHSGDRAGGHEGLRQGASHRLPSHDRFVTTFHLINYHTQRDCVTRFYASIFFHKSSFPQAPENNMRVISNFFSKIRGDIHKSRCTIGVNDTGGK